MTHTSETSFTKFSNPLFESIYQYRCSGLKKDIILYLIRQTLGYHRNSVFSSITSIASGIRCNRIKTAQALNDLIDCGVIIVTGRRRDRTRSLSINRQTSEWRQCPLSQDVSQEGNINVPKTTTPPDDLGIFERSHMGYFGVPQTGYTPESAYIDGKDAVFQPKENFKENKKNINIYLYDINLIPRTLSYIEDFKEMFNNWCIHRKQMGRPLTHTAIEVQMRKLLLFNSEGYNVISIIENSITSSWTDFYRPGTRQDHRSKPVEYRSCKDIENESY